MTTRQKIAARIKEMRARSGLSQSELARAVGVERQQVASWEDCRNKPGEDSFLLVASILKTSISYLFGETDYPDQLPPSSDADNRNLSILSIRSSRLSDKRFYKSAIQSGAKHFVYALNITGKPLVKFGHTMDVRSRISSLKTSCPFPVTCLSLIGFETKELAIQFESMIHSSFSKWNSSGEWFHAVDPLTNERTEVKTFVEFLMADGSYPVKSDIAKTYLSMVSTKKLDQKEASNGRHQCSYPHRPTRPGP